MNKENLMALEMQL